MGKRINLYVGPRLAQLIKERAGEGRSTSGVVNAVADRYLETIRRYTPRLAVNEWLAVIDALNGVWAGDNAALAVQSLPYGVSDHLTLEGAAEKWEVDAAALVKRLEALDWCQRLAVIDAAERFWARSDWPADRRELVVAVVGEQSVVDDAASGTS